MSTIILYFVYGLLAGVSGVVGYQNVTHLEGCGYKLGTLVEGYKGEGFEYNNSFGIPGGATYILVSETEMIQIALSKDPPTVAEGRTIAGVVDLGVCVADELGNPTYEVLMKRDPLPEDASGQQTSDK